GKWDWLRGLQTALLNQEFTTGKYRTYKIPKPGKQGFRTIEVPDTETRIVSKTMLDVLRPLLDPSFYPLSIGFRPGRSRLHGIAAAEQLVKRGLTHWVKCDIRDAFGQIPKPTLLEVLKSRLKGSSIMWLIEEVLGKDRKRGIPQGVAISPLAMNVYLDHFLDAWWVENFPETCLVRYADDILIACPSRQSAIDAFNALDQRARTIGMPIKEKLTDALFDLNSGDVVEWLGFQIKLTQDELDFSLGVNSWDRLEFKLQEVKVRKEKGDIYTRDKINSIGFGRVLEKAVAIEEHQIAAVAQQIRELADEANLDMTGFTDDDAHEAWLKGRQKWQEAREDVIPWLPAA
ncbi:MAG: reverse transcriptase/maturase family protein, partial [Rubripirellula sp.]